MRILVIKTDGPEAKLAIFDDDQRLVHKKWNAQGSLAETINAEIEKLLNELSISIEDIEGILCFEGPGSFTGLRIGLSVGNALAYAQNLPIITTKGENWLEQGIKKLKAGQNQKIIVPFYGSNPNITKPKN